MDTGSEWYWMMEGSKTFGTFDHLQTLNPYHDGTAKPA
jgi:hypothetical protein